MEMEMEMDIRAVVGLDFGTTFSGYTFCHIEDDNNPVTNDKWPGAMGQLKTNTALRYDEHYENVESWGQPALSKRQRNKKKGNKNESRPVELFKLHLGKLSDKLKPELQIDYKKAITDYFREIGEDIKDKVITAWSEIKFLEQVLIVIAIPAEFLEKDKGIMRDCAHKAELIKEKNSKNLQFTTEPEAAAIYCMKNCLRIHNLNTPGTTFMIVDCGGGTVDLTTRVLLEDQQLGEVTERAGDFCGSTFIDQEFIKALSKILGDDAIKSLQEKHYGQMQFMIQEFCSNAKLPFTGDKNEFKNYELDLDYIAPSLKEYVTEEIENRMEEDEWLITFKYEDIKSMFDPIVERIIKMIQFQLTNARETCSAMFLVGGFSQSKYLQNRIKQEFQHKIRNISVPTFPISAVSRGAVLYGSSMIKSGSNFDNVEKPKFVISDRILKYTYGIRISPVWKDGDPVERKRSNGRIRKFRVMARKGTKVKTNQEITLMQLPAFPNQDSISFHIYYTTEYHAKYCDEEGMQKLGRLKVSLPDVHLGTDRPVLFGLTFGHMEITASAKNQLNGQNYQTTLKLDV